MKLKRSTKFWLWLTVITIGAMIVLHEYVNWNVMIAIGCIAGFFQIMWSLGFTDYHYEEHKYLIDELTKEGEFNYIEALFALTNPFVLISMLNKALNKYDDETNQTE